MTAKFFGTRTRFLFAACACLLLLLNSPNVPLRTHAQGNKVTLISEETSTRAVAVESVTQTREPFATTSPVNWGTDNRTRIMLFAMGVPAGENASAVTADAEDGAHNIYHLTVEYVGVVPEQEWATSIVVRLNDQMADVGDVLVGISYQGSPSNRVRVGIGHVGGGPPDDPGSVPTPGTIAPPPQPATTAGTLTTAEVQTIIAQAVSAAAQLGHPVTVAVTDREANVLGVFKMTGAPATSQFRGGGPGPSQVPNPLTGFVPIGFDGTAAPATLGASSTAATASIFTTRGYACTARTASFILTSY